MLFGLHDKTFILKRPANPTKAMSDWCDVIHKVLLDKHEDGEVEQNLYKATSLDRGLPLIDIAMKIPITV